VKFLTFNIVVAVGLVYLFTGGDWSLQKLKESVFEASALPENLTPKLGPKRTEKAVAKVITPPVEKKTPSLSPAPVKLAPVQIAESRPAVKNPAPRSSKVIARRAEVLASRTYESAAAPNTELMSPEERRRSLLSIAEDMELFSVEAALQ
jgi:hypothetical protein